MSHRQLRVIVKRRRDDDSQVQFLQEKRWYGWKTVDKEAVPMHVSISLGTTGDTGGWISKFTKYGHFGRDGVIHPT